IYYIPKHQGILITSDFAEIQKRMDIGMDPRIEYIKISVSDFDQFTIKGFSLKKVDNAYFQSVKGIFSKYKFEAIAFHDSNVDLSDVVWDVGHLFIGDNAKINLSAGNFSNLK